MNKFLFLIIGAFLSLNVVAGQVHDDTGQAVLLDSPPEKIISLAPHLTELLFSLGVGDRIVATVKYSDYPEAALEITRLGDAFSLSSEAVVALEPDLIVAWTTGGNQRTLQQLKSLGYPVYLNEAASLNEIASTVERLGELVGEAEAGERLAANFREELANIEGLNSGKRAARVFFQIADTQLYTVNDQHLIGQALAACGAQNVFGNLSIPVPLVSLEAVVEANPEFIVVSSPREGYVTRWEKEWHRFSLDDRVRYINASLITRPSLRMLKGIKSLCNLLESP